MLNREYLQTIKSRFLNDCAYFERPISNDSQTFTLYYVHQGELGIKSTMFGTRKRDMNHLNVRTKIRRKIRKLYFKLSLFRYQDLNMISFYTVLVTILCWHAITCEPAHGGGGTVDDSPQARQVFRLSDKNNDTHLVYSEFELVFTDLDTNNDSVVTSDEFLKLWTADHIGMTSQGITLFTNLDVNKDFIIDQVDMPYIFMFFDRDQDLRVTEGEFVVQWVKISS